MQALSINSTFILLKLGSMKIFSIIGSIIYSILLPIWACFVCILIILYAYINPSNVHKLANFWGASLIKLLTFFTRLKVEYKNIPKNPKGQIFAAQHQSVLEILALLAVVEKPVFVLKKSLMSIPIFGKSLKCLGMIPVDRKNINLNWMEETKKQLDMGRNLIIFPEGTRVEYGKEIPYRAGVFKLAKHLDKKITPVAVNTGLFWPRRSWIKKPGTAKIVFGQPIDADMKLLREKYKELLN